jgi:hypothetical protein
MDLTRKRERDRLSVRREPYWHRLNKGAALGFRRGPDTWVLRYTDRASGKTKYAALEDDNLDFDQAKEKAETELGHRTKSAVRVAKRETVKAALETYLEDLRRHDRGAAAEDAEWRFKKYVYGDVLAELPLERVTRDDFEEWRERQRPGRENRTVNRQVRSVKAALNRALELGHLGNPLTWKLKPLSDDAEDTNDTAIFLTPAQRKALIADQAWAADEGKDDDRMWTGHLWARRVRAAIEKHNNATEKEVDKIPELASAYSFRHTRISELLQVHNIDPITVAQQTGTSVAMIEKTYLKFIATAMRAKLAAIKEDASQSV